jgi:hypothetical protein
MHKRALALVTLLAACGGKTTDAFSTTDASVSDTAGSTDASPADYSACSAPGTCILAAKNCCGVCGEPRLTDVNAVNEARVAEYTKAVCPVPRPCPDCPSAIQPNLQAFCRSGRCTAVDIRTDALSTCATDGDCMLRYEACCECGASGDFSIIALNATKAGDYARERCKTTTSCAECAPAYPATLKAVCDAVTKHCVVKPV